ncbi:MAG: hypothetical protein ACOC5D_02990 [Thermoplasmatota archaeon]
MDKRITGVGLIVLFIGIILIATFWPLFGVEAKEMKKDDRKFINYDPGDEINVYGVITEIKTDFPSYLENLGMEDNVLIELGGNVWVLIKNENSIDFDEGDSVYFKTVLRESESIGISYEYWELESSNDINLKNNLDYIFYFIAGTGAVISSAGFVKE